MKRSRILLPLILGLLCILTGPLSAVEIQYFAVKDNVPRKMPFNAYYFSHNIRIHSLKPLGLELSVEEYVTMFNVIAANASEQANLIIVKDFVGGKDLRILYRLIGDDEKSMLIMTTNLDIDTRTIVDEPAGNEVASLFYIKNGRLVYFADTYLPEREKALRESGKRISLADFFLMDDNFENDKEVTAIYSEILQDETSSDLDRCIAKMSQGQIALIDNDLETARRIRDEVESNISNITAVSDRSVAETILQQFTLEISIMSGLLEK